MWGSFLGRGHDVQLGHWRRFRSFHFCCLVMQAARSCSVSEITMMSGPTGVREFTKQTYYLCLLLFRPDEGATGPRGCLIFVT